MKCPICKKGVRFGDSYMPFCSERCRLIDLGNWASEKYVISSPINRSESEAAEPPDREDKKEERER